MQRSKQCSNHHRLISAVLLAALLVFASSPTILASKRIIASGTRYSTAYYVNDSGRVGPTVVVVGGVHGNEPAGYLAARRLESTTPRRGTLAVIPEANVLGIEEDARVGGLPGDLNRDFPRKKGESPDTVLARSMWSVVTGLHPDYLIDLHEGYDYHRLRDSSVGQSIIYYPKGDAFKMAKAVQDSVNQTVDSASHAFVLLRYPIKGSLARAVGMFTDANAMILETSKKDPLETRIDHHVRMVDAALESLDML